MSYDALSEVIDEPLSVSLQTVQQLKRLRHSEKFANLPGIDTAEEQNRLSQLLNELLDRLIAGVLTNPSKLWVMREFQISLEAAQMEDTEAREKFRRIS